jgi:pteridine reductase
MNADLTGKTGLITGGARRVGAAITRRLHAAGANVLVHYRDSDADAAKLVAELNGVRPKSAATVKAELLAPIAPRALVSAALESFGRLDLLVNNASAFFPVALGAIEASHWEELVGSNLRAPLFIAQEAAAELAKHEGAIVNIVDIPRRAAAEAIRVRHRQGGTGGDARSSLARHGCVGGVAPAPLADGQFDPTERDRVIATTPAGELRRRHHSGILLPRLCALSPADPGGGWQPYS